MPRQLRDMTRTTRAPSSAAADFGSDRPFHYSGGDFYSRTATAELASLFLRKLQLNQDYLITVEPTGRSVSNLATDLDRIMRKFSAWWGKRHRTGPDGEPRSLTQDSKPASRNGVFGFGMPGSRKEMRASVNSETSLGSGS